MSYAPLAASQIQEWNHLLANPQTTDWNRLGKSIKDKSWRHYFNTLLDGKKQAYLLSIAENLNKSFVHLEQKGTKFFNDAQAAQKYRERFTPYFNLAEAIQKQVQELRGHVPELETQIQELEMNLVALKYRLTASNGGIDKADRVHEPSFEKLKELALQWKKKQVLSNDPQHLNELELEQLREASKYQEWIPFLSKNKKQADEFFNWALRDYNLVDVFVAYRATQRNIKKSLISCILGRIRRPGEDESLAIEKVKTKVDGVHKQILTLPVYHGRFDQFEADKQERINILNPSKEVHFRNGNRIVPLREIWDNMGQKNLRESSINVCAWGIINFHPVHGVWNADQQRYVMPELTEHNWLQHVPPAEIAQGKDIEARYGDKVADRDIFVKVAATRQYRSLNALNCHGFKQVFVRMDNGNWRVLDVGFYAYRFQKNLLDGLALFCATVPRVLSRQDQNGSYTHRQQARYPIFESEDDTQETLKRIYQNSLKEAVFQFSGKNCSYPIQRGIEKSHSTDIPNFFRMPVTKGSIGLRFLDKLLAFFDHCPGPIKKLGILFLSLILGSLRVAILFRNDKEVRESVFKYYWQNNQLYNPSYLPHQIELAKQTGEGPLKDGEVYWGNTESRLLASLRLRGSSPH